MRRGIAVLALVAIGACGGGGSPEAAPATTAQATTSTTTTERPTTTTDGLTELERSFFSDFEAWDRVDPTEVVNACFAMSIAQSMIGNADPDPRATLDSFLNDELADIPSVIFNQLRLGDPSQKVDAFMAACVHVGRFTAP